MTLNKILLIAALICFIFAAFGFPVTFLGLVPLGLALWVLSSIV